MNFPRILAVAALGLVGTLGTAKADVISSITVEIWSANTPGATSGSPTQQALPSAALLLGAPVLVQTNYAAPINYNLQSGTDTIGGFFAANSPASAPPTGCGSASTCSNTLLSSSTFSHVTLFEFVAREVTRTA
jgi:hypothetical protein